MNINTLLSLIKIKGVKQAKLAKRVGISRQSITAWKQRSLVQRDPNINIFSSIQNEIARELGVNITDLETPININENLHLRGKIEADLIWDKLFPDVESFVSAAVCGNNSALGRLVQVYGMYLSAKLLGKNIWIKFPDYKSNIHPAYRKRAEIIWNLEQNQN